jgi:hypothetical protein
MRACGKDTIRLRWSVVEGQSFEQFPPLAAVALGLVGLAIGLLGYYLILTFARIEAALILGILAAAPGAALGLWFVALPGLVAGLVVGFIFGRAYLKLNMAINGAAGGAAIGLVASMTTGLPWWLFVPLGAILFGALAFVDTRPILVIGTSAVGGVLAGICAGAGLHSAGLIDADKNKLPVAGLALGAWAVCAFVQFRITSEVRLKRRQVDPDPWSRVSRL